MVQTLPEKIVPRKTKSVIPKVYAPAEILQSRADNLITEDQGVVLLNKYLKETFDQDRLRHMLDEICKAENVRHVAGEGFFKTPDWKARVEGFDRVMKLLRYFSTDKQAPTNHPTKVIFNTIFQETKQPSEKKTERSKKHGV